MRYIAKPNNWFDGGTEVELIDDYRKSINAPCNIGLFKGLCNGVLDEEVCNFDEFEEVE